jgi:ubiquinone/menaquinone biosynthesis C-methylase UbiE
MAAPSDPDQIREVNERYHDVAAVTYDSKWGIDFGEIGLQQVSGKLEKVLGSPLPPLGRIVEIGAGTGYFSLNLLLGGACDEVVATDISQGMIDALEGNAKRLKLDVETHVCEAEALPLGDESVDTVIGHAVLHHLPDLDAAFDEFYRVLKPGGMLFFGGEPSKLGDRIANVPKTAAGRVSPLWRAAVRARPAPAPHEDGSGTEEEHDLERVVDVHAFEPDALSSPAVHAGFTDVDVVGEELLANWFGWTNRVLEASATPEDVPWAWRQYAYRGYLALQKVDRSLLEGKLPPAIFYNLLLGARKPA